MTKGILPARFKSHILSSILRAKSIVLYISKTCSFVNPKDVWRSSDIYLSSLKMIATTDCFGFVFSHEFVFLPRLELLHPQSQITLDVNESFVIFPMV